MSSIVLGLMGAAQGKADRENNLGKLVLLHELPIKAAVRGLGLPDSLRLGESNFILNGSAL